MLKYGNARKYFNHQLRHQPADITTATTTSTSYQPNGFNNLSAAEEH